ncbi:MAG: hypothetical protein J6I73_00040 [Treponema sp.]|nr:hypothetical protein [Treponema sp.]
MKQLKIWNTPINSFLKKTCLWTSAALAMIFTASCTTHTETRLTVWTNCAEFAPYAELFNNMHDTKKILPIYKKNPANELSLSRADFPDVIIASNLRTNKTARQFRPIDTIFDRKSIAPTIFYPQLLEAGNIQHVQYLLPVSFNLPAVIFSKKNSEFIENDYMLSLDQIRTIGAAFNMQQQNGMYSRIGFAPLASDEFLYFAVKAKGAKFRESKTAFTWNEKALASAILFLQNWTNEANGSSLIEQDFIYKYLFTSNYKQVTSDRTLFTYITSNQLFQLSTEQTTFIDYRWIYENDKIPIEDSFVMLGIPRRSKHPNAAYDFIHWFLNADTQQAILEYNATQNLDTNFFGIAGGFSSIKSVNEHILPLHNIQLLTNTPPTDMLAISENLPANWDSMKEQIVLPFLKDKITSTSETLVDALDVRIDEWTKQNYN